MNRRSAVAIVAAALATAALPMSAALAKDVQLHVELDGRPLDAQVPSALLHRGRSYVDVVRITKGLAGLLTFGKDDRSVSVTVGTETATFVIGSRSGMMNGRPTKYSAAPFILYGDTYVPLDAIADLADARLTVDVKHRVARLVTLTAPQ